VQREPDAVIGDAVLRKVVRADLRGAIARSNLGLPIGEGPGESVQGALGGVLLRPAAPPLSLSGVNSAQPEVERVWANRDEVALA
jgi:hypothetical protein